MNDQNFKYLSPSKFDLHFFENFENPRIIFVLLYDVHIENMFTINLEDGREAPSKASDLKLCKFGIQSYFKLRRRTL